MLPSVHPTLSTAMLMRLQKSLLVLLVITLVATPGRATQSTHFRATRVHLSDNEAHISTPTTLFRDDAVPVDPKSLHVVSKIIGPGEGPEIETDDLTGSSGTTLPDSDDSKPPRTDFYSTTSVNNDIKRHGMQSTDFQQPILPPELDNQSSFKHASVTGGDNGDLDTGESAKFEVLRSVMRSGFGLQPRSSTTEKHKNLKKRESGIERIPYPPYPIPQFARSMEEIPSLEAIKHHPIIVRTRNSPNMASRTKRPQRQPSVHQPQPFLEYYLPKKTTGPVRYKLPQQLPSASAYTSSGVTPQAHGTRVQPRASNNPRRPPRHGTKIKQTPTAASTPPIFYRSKNPSGIKHPLQTISLPSQEYISSEYAPMHPLMFPSSKIETLPMPSNQHIYQTSLDSYPQVLANSYIPEVSLRDIYKSTTKFQPQLEFNPMPRPRQKPEIQSSAPKFQGLPTNFEMGSVYPTEILLPPERPTESLLPSRRPTESVLPLKPQKQSTEKKEVPTVINHIHITESKKSGINREITIGDPTVKIIDDNESELVIGGSTKSRKSNGSSGTMIRIVSPRGVNRQDTRDYEASINKASPGRHTHSKSEEENLRSHPLMAGHRFTQALKIPDTDHIPTFFMKPLRHRVTLHEDVEMLEKEHDSENSGGSFLSNIMNFFGQGNTRSQEKIRSDKTTQNRRKPVYRDRFEELIMNLDDESFDAFLTAVKVNKIFDKSLQRLKMNQGYPNSAKIFNRRSYQLPEENSEELADRMIEDFVSVLFQEYPTIAHQIQHDKPFFSASNEVEKNLFVIPEARVNDMTTYRGLQNFTENLHHFSNKYSGRTKQWADYLSHLLAERYLKSVKVSEPVRENLDIIVNGIQNNQIDRSDDWSQLKIRTEDFKSKREKILDESKKRYQNLDAGLASGEVRVQLGYNGTSGTPLHQILSEVLDEFIDFGNKDKASRENHENTESSPEFAHLFTPSFIKTLNRHLENKLRRSDQCNGADCPQNTRYKNPVESKVEKNSSREKSIGSRLLDYLRWFSTGKTDDKRSKTADRVNFHHFVNSKKSDFRSKNGEETKDDFMFEEIKEKYFGERSNGNKFFPEEDRKNSRESFSSKFTSKEVDVLLDYLIQSNLHTRSNHIGPYQYFSTPGFNQQMPLGLPNKGLSQSTGGVKAFNLAGDGGLTASAGYGGSINLAGHRGSSNLAGHGGSTTLVGHGGSTTLAGHGGSTSPAANGGSANLAGIGGVLGSLIGRYFGGVESPTQKGLGGIAGAAAPVITGYGLGNMAEASPLNGIDFNLHGAGRKPSENGLRQSDVRGAMNLGFSRGITPQLHNSPAPLGLHPSMVHSMTHDGLQTDIRPVSKFGSRLKNGRPNTGAGGHHNQGFNFRNSNKRNMGKNFNRFSASRPPGFNSHNYDYEDPDDYDYEFKMYSQIYSPNGKITSPHSTATFSDHNDYDHHNYRATSNNMRNHRKKKRRFRAKQRLEEYYDDYSEETHVLKSSDSNGSSRDSPDERDYSSEANSSDRTRPRRHRENKGSNRQPSRQELPSNSRAKKEEEKLDTSHKNEELARNGNSGTGDRTEDADGKVIINIGYPLPSSAESSTATVSDKADTNKEDPSSSKGFFKTLKNLFTSYSDLIQGPAKGTFAMFSNSDNQVDPASAKIAYSHRDPSSNVHTIITTSKFEDDAELEPPRITSHPRIPFTNSINNRHRVNIFPRHQRNRSFFDNAHSGSTAVHQHLPQQNILEEKKKNATDITFEQVSYTETVFGSSSETFRTPSPLHELDLDPLNPVKYGPPKTAEPTVPKVLTQPGTIYFNGQPMVRYDESAENNDARAKRLNSPTQ
ncbi:uncharacterized protein LOC108674668 isoform X2 [Hyalella azteca]|uniref:Uncharacterized protein LOC108674668 isoform X2 n=1 Tax=Hyalella azteca TaxID=294128 RepID=A0A979FG52_HYAAZ|nr:uncharacterized protein LOC108674668 isoform X2 [Hyalella azteca]